jgi:hypothetical protein
MWGMLCAAWCHELQFGFQAYLLMEAALARLRLEKHAELLLAIRWHASDVLMCINSAGTIVSCFGIRVRVLHK